MRRAFASTLAVAAFCAAGIIGTASGAAAAPADCPDGKIRFAVEPFESAARMTPAYDAVAKALEQKMGCPVELFIATNYNAEIEAMRAGKVDLAEFGPLGYVLAHQVAQADVFATYADAKGQPSTYTASIVTWKGSGINTIKDVAGKTFAYSDPASTSGHLFPAYGLRKNGIDPDNGIKPLYAGSHTASFEAIRNKKVDAGELNSVQITASQQAGEYTAGDFPTLWQSSAIPNDPVSVRRSLPDPFKKRLMAAVLSLDFTTLPPDAVKVFPAKGTTKFVPQIDSAYDEIRDLVKTLNVDLNKL